MRPTESPTIATMPVSLAVLGRRFRQLPLLPPAGRSAAAAAAAAGPSWCAAGPSTASPAARCMPGIAALADVRNITGCCSSSVNTLMTCVAEVEWATVDLLDRTASSGHGDHALSCGVQHARMERTAPQQQVQQQQVQQQLELHATAGIQAHAG